MVTCFKEDDSFHCAVIFDVETRVGPVAIAFLHKATAAVVHDDQQFARPAGNEKNSTAHQRGRMTTNEGSCYLWHRSSLSLTPSTTYFPNGAESQPPESV